MYRKYNPQLDPRRRNFTIRFRHALCGWDGQHGDHDNRGVQHEWAWRGGDRGRHRRLYLPAQRAIGLRLHSYRIFGPALGFSQRRHPARQPAGASFGKFEKWQIALHGRPATASAYLDDGDQWQRSSLTRQRLDGAVLGCRHHQSNHLDIYADISVRMAVGSATPPAGAWLGISWRHCSTMARPTATAS